MRPFVPQANVAQLVEQLTRNEQVSGSSPLIGSQENASNDAEKADFGAFFHLHWSLRACKERHLFAVDCPPLRVQARQAIQNVLCYFSQPGSIF